METSTATDRWRVGDSGTRDTTQSLDRERLKPSAGNHVSTWQGPARQRAIEELAGLVLEPDVHLRMSLAINVIVSYLGDVGDAELAEHMLAITA